MRKASAFRRSWSYHLYRASVRESTGLLVRSPQLSLFHTESSPSSTAKNYDRVNSNDHRPPKSLIVRVDDSQATVPSIFGCKSYVSATGVSKPPESTTTAGSLDVFLPKTIPRLLRQDIYRPAFISGAHERASCTTGGLASAGNDAENCAKKFDCGQESYLDAKFQDTWSFYLKQGPYGRNCGEEFHQELQTQIRKVQGFLADFEDSDSRNPVQREKGYPKTGAVYWNWNGAPLGLGLSSSLTFPGISGRFPRRASICTAPSPSQRRSFSSGVAPPTKSETTAEPLARDYSQRAVVTALWCNFLVFCLKLGVWMMTSSHVMLAEAIHSLADLANQGLLAYGLMSSKRAPDAMHPYGYTKERFVWSLISAVGIFCLGSGATIIHGVQNLFSAQPLENVYLAALVIGGSMIMEGASLLVAISCVRNGAKAEGMTMRDYLWRGHDPTSVAVMMEDGAAVTGLGIAACALAAAHYTGNPMWDPIGSIVVGNLLGGVAIFLIQRNRHALLGRSMDDKDMMRVITLLSKDPVVDAIYDCKSEVIGPGAYRFKAEIDFNGVVIVQNYLKKAGRGNWHKEFHEAVSGTEPGHLDRVMAAYGEEIVSALGSEVDRLEKEIQKIVPGIRHVDIEAHNPQGPAPREKLYIY
ncbi:solute carrier family 30 (zinc transporter), member 9 [Marchantia polymorpha subsp. ruderalis]|uniref:Cation efflux protein transmembrane domain-containing protein n=2 Tax=Marchantia polymorpha TaxID=3197 RepID=A0AAF6BIW6_MARPO|nr:hypothetical protein MARPO_0185s0006 [Marchantia polymorpha]BBN11950.1 hypothetical protein Mp_5g16190 [Marchantia polymorpha subsp. ruderalis]|eukprot:PTQ27730.1 hypothetical protein MARPO_0185s0006 [Marchantia polymorpha]